MKLLLKSFVIVWTGLFITSCATSNKTDAMANDNYKKTVEGKIGSPVEYINNQANDKILCLNKEENTDDTKVKQVFVVWDIEKNQIIYEKNMKGGYVKWFDNDHLEVSGVIGVVQPDKVVDDYIQIVNVTSNQTMSKSGFLKTKDQ